MKELKEMFGDNLKCCIEVYEDLLKEYFNEIEEHKRNPENITKYVASFMSDTEFKNNIDKIYWETKMIALLNFVYLAGQFEHIKMSREL